MPDYASIPGGDAEWYGTQGNDTVIADSLPGFTFSSPLTKPGINCWNTPDLWVKLMREVLGYKLFGV